jgi:hypothetical protein
MRTDSIRLSDEFIQDAIRTCPVLADQKRATYRDVYGLGEYEEGYVGISTLDSDAYLENGTLFNKITIYSNHLTGVRGWKSWGITDAEGNLIIGVNNPTDAFDIPKSIYLKVEKKDY